MKLKFEPNLDYQKQAIEVVAGIFAGQPKDEGGADLIEQKLLDIEGDQLTLEQATARGNNLFIDVDQITDNVHEIQRRNRIELSHSGGANVVAYVGGKPQEFKNLLLEGMNFSVEMETGTGKTYVYLRTIHELNQQYGFKKYIIVVPSVAIREGVLKNLKITKEHFAEVYDNPEMNYYLWDPKKKGQAREFATNDSLQIMVITIDSFAKAKNIMNVSGDHGRPLDSIRATNPIVIIDEPQNMETEIRKKAIESLNPLCTLRYSATHKNPYNLMYRLTPVDAYDKRLVKKIEVDSVVDEAAFNEAYVRLIEVRNRGKNAIEAKIEIDRNDEQGLQRRMMVVESGDDLERITGRSVYGGFVVDKLNREDQELTFTNSQVFYAGQNNEGLREEMARSQIYRTVENHFQKQKDLADRNIKVLSLFFIDKVVNYREYVNGGVVKGKFAKWFEEAFEEMKAKPKFAGVMDLPTEKVHNGYFSQDKKTGHWQDSRDTKGEGGKTQADGDTYTLIMKDKERLLNANEPLCFIFSHSALREGWDNPNVFNICTLNETSSEMKKRQEIGRGLRLPVDANGERIRDEQVNILTVVANESYEEFSEKLQTEIEEETGINFSGRIKKKQDRVRVKITKRLELSDEFKALWDKIKHKTKYSVAIDEEELIKKSVEYLSEVKIRPPKKTRIKTVINKMSDGFIVNEHIVDTQASQSQVVKVPNVLADIEFRTKIIKKVVFEILNEAGLVRDVLVNPQQLIDEVSVAINRAKQKLAVDGIKYEKTGEFYDMQQFENDELQAYLYGEASKSGAVKVEREEKTVYDYVQVDSEIERNFMQSLESSDNVNFYVKLPNWFKIETPLGSYNPDWAVAFENEEKVYFVAETKDSNNLYDNSISDDERGKILAGRKHFEEIDLKYFAPVKNYQSVIEEING